MRRNFSGFFAESEEFLGGNIHVVTSVFKDWQVLFEMDDVIKIVSVCTIYCWSPFCYKLLCGTLCNEIALIKILGVSHIFLSY